MPTDNALKTIVVAAPLDEVLTTCHAEAIVSKVEA